MSQGIRHAPFITSCLAERQGARQARRPQSSYFQLSAPARRMAARGGVILACVRMSKNEAPEKGGARWRITDSNR